MTGLAAQYGALPVWGTSARGTGGDVYTLSDLGEVVCGALQIEDQCNELHAPVRLGAFEHIDVEGSSQKLSPCTVGRTGVPMVGCLWLVQ